MFNLKPDPVVDSDVSQMDSMYWAWRKKKDTDFDIDREHCEGLANEYERLYDWLSYCEREYQQPLPQYASRR